VYLKVGKSLLDGILKRHFLKNKKKKNARGMTSGKSENFN